MGNVQWVDLPPWALAGIVVLGLAQLSLQVLALVTLFRTPEERLVGGRRWVWIVAIVFGQFVGPIVFFSAARKPPVQEDPLQDSSDSDAPAQAKARQAADLLYGNSSRTKGHRDER